MSAVAHGSLGAHIFEMRAKHENDMRQLGTQHNAALVQMKKQEEKVGVIPL
jgi:hypothetical protein